MKSLVTGLACAALAGTTMIAFALDASAARPKREKYKSYPRSASSERPSTVGQNGLCQRDNGRPDDKLDFRVKCDVEEFWQRQLERNRRN